MPDYSKAKLYKVWSPQTREIYVGSTIQTLSNRISGHRTDLKRYKAGKKGKYCTSFKILEYGDARIELLEKYDACTCRDELLAREGKYIRELDCVNKRIAGRTDKQYYLDNKDKINAKDKKYREANKDKIKEYREANRDKYKEYLNKYYEANKDKYKEYAQKNKEAIRAKKKEYREANKEKLNAKVQCECGCTITKRSLKRHQQTAKHKKLMQNK